MKKFIFIFFFQLFFTAQAQAYVEPGIVTMIVQAIIAGIVGFIGFLAFYWQKFKNFLKKIFIKSKHKNKN